MENKNLVFAIDVDGVLRNNLSTMVDLYNKNFDDNKTVDDITDFMTEVSFPKIESVTGQTASSWFFQKHSKEIFEDAESYPNIKEDIETLQEFGKVIIVTYQKTFLNKRQTLDWLEKNGINPDGICFLKDKSFIHADYFIDDNDWNLVTAHSKCGVLITAPYNAQIDMDEFWEECKTCNSVIRCESLHDFVKKFKSNKLYNISY